MKRPDWRRYSSASIARKKLPLPAYWYIGIVSRRAQSRIAGRDDLAAAAKEIVNHKNVIMLRSDMEISRR